MVQIVSDAVSQRSSAVFYQAFERGMSEAAGRLGDLQIRSKSEARALLLCG
jgi:hypothetical protein